MPDTIDSLRARIRDLEEELDVMKTLAKNHYSDENHLILATRIKHHFRPRGVGPARMLALLYVSRRPLSAEYIAESIPPRINELRDPHIVRVWASYCREAIGRDGLAGEKGVGYYLTDTGRETLRSALT